MSLDGALSIAASSLANITGGFGLISQNVANAQTPAYATETATSLSVLAGDQPLGVRGGIALRAGDPALEASVNAATSDAANYLALSRGLSIIAPALGAVGGASDIGSLVDGVQSAFAALLNDPANQSLQSAVVNAASTLTAGINRISAAYGAARQTAQDSLVANVASLNTTLASIGGFNTQIVALHAQGQSTAGLENQRAQAMQNLTNFIPARFVGHTDGSITVLAGNGVELPLDGANPLSVAPATTGPNAYYPAGGLPGIMINGADITQNLTGGSIGAAITLRDQTIPRFQAELDQFSQGLAARFDAQGLTLFSDAAGNVPAGGGVPVQAGFIGFASAISVNPAIITTPSLVRDGTHAVTASALGATAYTPNPLGLPGFTGMVTRILSFALGTDVQTGIAQAALPTAGLGPAGSLAAPFAGALAIADFGRALTAAQAGDIGGAQSAAYDASAVHASLAANLTNVEGVSVDAELGRLIVLQNAYGASAKIITTIQAMMSEALGMVR